MIYYVCQAAQTHTIERFIQTVGQAAASRLRTISYHTLLRAPEIPVGHYIFANIDRLSDSQIEWAGALADRIVAAAPKARILNHPLRALSRYALLRTLALRGLNPFDLARLDEQRPLRFPVFIRRESGADGPESSLLADEEAYTSELERLESAGLSRKDRVAVEYADTRDADGRFRKYSAVRIGNQLVPVRLSISGEWTVKRANRLEDDASAALEDKYLRSNPHRAELKRIFKIANIEYGCIDYTVIDGRTVTFEIDTHPELPGADSKELTQAHRKFARDALLDAFHKLDAPLRGPKSIASALVPAREES